MPKPPADALPAQRQARLLERLLAEGWNRHAGGSDQLVRWRTSGGSPSGAGLRRESLIRREVEAGALAAPGSDQPRHRYSVLPLGPGPATEVYVDDTSTLEASAPPPAAQLSGLGLTRKALCAEET